MPNWEKIRLEWETTKITFKALAEKHGVKEGTLKSRRSREKWTRDATKKKDATKTRKVATNSKEVQPKKEQRYKEGSRKGAGNPSPVKQFAKRNSAARKHGLRAKYFTDTQKEIMEDFEDFSIADQLWLQIEIKFSAIIHLQKIMWVEHDDDTLSEISMESSGMEGSSEAYKVVYAFEQYEAYIRAQSRAMAEYRNLVKQFLELAHDEDERKLKLELMQHQIDKTKAETEKITKEQDGGSPPVITIVDEWSDASE
ncbi:hypothetical protein [Oceanobacillus alkalisoli]|uniref:hypothetical protein n=1 Tax=Oceanobacillus alkalisoli TaxID=2925113 RepID=UPI001EE4E6DD|nr:hypothetical protein [Oceanobacillus alkalisoli]MCG5104437.1 hypothetical protein [Oceanobacillus alkalisoli]